MICIHIDRKLEVWAQSFVFFIIGYYLDGSCLILPSVSLSQKGQ